MRVRLIKAISVIVLAAILLISCSQRASNAPPTIDYIYNTADTHRAVGEYFQAAMGVAGINVRLSNQEWNTFLNTRKNGNYTIARNGWVADYTDPISFLDMWVSASGNNDVGFGKGEHKNISVYSLDLTEYGYDINIENGTWEKTYDRLIEIIKACSDIDTRYRLMHLAEDMLMSTGCIMPIYYNTDIYMVDRELQGFFTTPLGYKYFMYSTYKGRDTLSLCLASEPDTLDPALNSALDGATMLAHLFSGLARWETNSEGVATVVADCAEELPMGEDNPDGTVTYTYRLKDGLTWSDGKPLTAYDFEYAWKRAADSSLAADYGYMFEFIKGYGTDSLAVDATDSRTLSVTTSSRVSFWNELLAFPTYYPVREDIVAGEGWATEAETYVGNGPYRIKGWQHDSLIHLEKNPYYHEKESITMRELKFFLSDDANNMLTNFKNGSWQLIDDVPTDELKRLEKEYPEEYRVSGLIGTYYLCWNINESILPKDSPLSGNEAELAMQEIRQAFSLLLDRNYIAEYIGQAGQVPASSFIAMGFKNPDGSEFYQTAGNAEDYYGYYDTSREAFALNTEKAIEILRKYYTLDIDY